MAENAENANVRLNLSSKAENVLIVRQALTGLAEALELGALPTNDIATGVTEACNNVVLHAYPPDAEGPLEVRVYALPHAVAVVVRDEGRGISAGEVDPSNAQGGIGLPVMRALATRVDFSGSEGTGTEVRMEFDAPGGVALAAENGRDARADAANRGLENTVELRLAPADVARTVLPRVLSALAARAYFSTDRISDVQLVADTLVAHASNALAGGELGVRVMLAPRDLQMWVGPLREGGGGQMLLAAVDGAGPVLERLTDDQRVSSEQAEETLELRMTERR
jgi:anti-sigma regulatory factor (Ser/Thr protein kinase)